MKTKLAGLIAIVAGLAAANTYADQQTPISITPISLTAANYFTPYSQDFNTLTNTPDATTSSTLPAGWGFFESGSAANGTYVVGTGSSATGNTYSFGAAAGNSERAFGGLQSGTLIPTLGAVFTNNTGGTVSQLTITYTGEEWRLGTTARTDQINFQYQVGGTDLTSGSWISFSSLDFTTPSTTGTAGARDGNTLRTTITATITNLNIADTQTVAIRWTDLNASGADDGLAVDDFLIAVPEPSTWVAGALALGAIAWTMRARLTRARATARVTA